MRREPSQLARSEFDLLVCGGGIYGAWAALDAAQRGLKVALIDRGDFAAATSANHQRIIHGGLRYLQHADILRLRQSVRERSTLLRMAPDLVHPLPVLVPTLPCFSQRRATMRAAMFANDLLSFDRNRALPASHRIPRGRLLARREAAMLADCFNFGAGGCTGAAVFYDAQVLSPERLVLSIVAAAVREGATVANYVEARGYLRRGTRVLGVTARDALSGQDLEIRAQMTMNCVGPWTAERLQTLSNRADPRLALLKASVLVVRDLGLRAALAVPGCRGHADRAEVMNKGYRNFFLSPWRGLTLIGTFYAPHPGEPGACEVSEDELDSWLHALREACPRLDLSRDDVLNVYCGLVPGAAAGAGQLELSKRSVLIDHAREDAVEGMISISGVKFTTARAVAERAVDIACARLGRQGRGRTARTRLRVLGPELIPDAHRALEAAAAPPIIRSAVTRAVREEMACTLADVVLRRTDLAIAGIPAPHVLEHCARVMGELLGWDQRRIAAEQEQVRKHFPLAAAETDNAAHAQHSRMADATPVRTP